MSKKFLFYTLLILLIVFGGAFYLTEGGKLPENLNIFKKKTEVVTSTPPSFIKANISKISNEEMKKLALGPAKNASESDIKKYSSTVSEASVYSRALDVSGCSPTPNILSFNENQPFMIVNKDSVSHSLSINRDGKYVVFAVAKPNYQNTIAIPGLKAGIYSYVCDSEGPAGMFVVR